MILKSQCKAMLALIRQQSVYVNNHVWLFEVIFDINVLCTLSYLSKKFSVEMYRMKIASCNLISAIYHTTCQKRDSSRPNKYILVANTIRSLFTRERVAGSVVIKNIFHVHSQWQFATASFTFWQPSLCSGFVVPLNNQVQTTSVYAQ